MPVFTKEISKETMTRSKLRNKYLKDRNGENYAMYAKQMISKYIEYDSLIHRLENWTSRAILKYRN